MSVADANRVILTGENPFIRLSERDGDPNKTKGEHDQDHHSDQENPTNDEYDK